jgi:hypothetical protein
MAKDQATKVTALPLPLFSHNPKTDILRENDTASLSGPQQQLIVLPFLCSILIGSEHFDSTAAKLFGD